MKKTKQLNAHLQQGILKVLLIMKLTIVLLLISFIQVSANGLSQSITVKLNKAELKKALFTIERKTNCRFLYNDDIVSSINNRISINVENTPVSEVLNEIFAGTNLTYKVLDNRLIVLSTKEKEIQDVRIKGRITDVNGAAVPGATIRVRGTNIATSADNDGRYSIPAPEGGTLIISSVGYNEIEVPINGRTEINVQLMVSTKVLDQVVVVGYGTQKQSSLTSSVATVKGNDFAQQPVGDLSNALGGRAAGIIFTQTGGQAGNDAANILIRGIGTNGTSDPLLIVDGVPRAFGQLNPSDIESVTILKDAAAVAPYGLGGANGVILVTTKRGKTGKPVFSYDAFVGWQNPTVLFHEMSSYQFATLKNLAATNDGNTSVPFTDAQIQMYKDGSDRDAYPNTDPFPDMLKKNALQTSHSLSLSGGSDKVKYAVGLGYYYQDGIMPRLDYKRYNLSSNLDIQATPTTKVSVNFNGRVEERHFTGSGTDMQSIFENLINTSPLKAFKFSNGYHSDLYSSYYDNNSYNLQTSPIMLSQMAIEQKLPIEGLKAKATFSYDFYPTFVRNWNQPYSYYAIDTAQHPHVYSLVEPTTLASFYESYYQRQNFTYQGQIDYARTFGKHAVTGMVVFEAITQKYSNLSASRNNYQVLIHELFAGSSASADKDNDGSGGGAKQRSIVYRLTYGFENKYLFEATGRYDGHYYFAPGHRFGFFPAFSLGWRISQEKFMKNIKWIDELKLRGSWGKSGNLAGSAFQYLTAYTIYSNAVVLNNTALSGLYEGTGSNGSAIEGNSNITWENAKKTDVGFDARLWNGLLTIEADYFHEKRSDMLIPPITTVPIEYGIGLPEANLGIMSNHGFEISIGSTKKFNKDITASLNVNFTYAKNKLIQIYENGATYNVAGRKQTGRALGEQFGYKAIGLFKESDFDANGNLNAGIPTQPWNAVKPGDIRYEDVNKNGAIDVNDQVPIGDPVYPAIVYGFSPSVKYKDFELSVLFQGAAQRSVQISGSQAFLFEQGSSAPVTALDYWTPTHQNASYPRVSTSMGENNSQTSSFWQRNASYLRLRTMMLAYNLPNSLVDKIRMRGIKVYVSGQNIFTWTKLKNSDPEIATNSVGGNSGRGWYFPTTKAITVGVNVQF